MKYVIPLLLAMTAITLALEPMERPLIIAHRGDSQLAPENTMAAIKSAVKCESDLIEFDVRSTVDGGLYLFHDEHLERFGGKKTELVAELTGADAEKIDVGSFFDAKFSDERPPTLAVALKTIIDGESIPLIERKTGSAEQYLAVLDELDARDKVIIQAFDWKFLADLQMLAPDVKLGALGSKKLASDRIELLKELSPDWVGWNQKDLTAENIKVLHSAGFRVAVWTVNDLARMQKFIAAGADAIITDRPGEMLEAVNK